MFTLKDVDKGDTVIYRSRSEVKEAVVWGKTSMPIPGDPEFVWIPHSSGKVAEVLLRNVVEIRRKNTNEKS
jgi:hypothetical protein